MFVRRSGAWHELGAAYVRRGGAWHELGTGSIRRSGAWYELGAFEKELIVFENGFKNGFSGTYSAKTYEGYITQVAITGTTMGVSGTYAGPPGGETDIYTNAHISPNIDFRKYRFIDITCSGSGSINVTGRSINPSSSSAVHRANVSAITETRTLTILPQTSPSSSAAITKILLIP